MRKKLAFPFFLVFLGAASSLYFSYRLAGSLASYVSLTHQADAQISRWEVREMQGKFAIAASYRFVWQEASWTGSSLLAGPPYLNEESAIEDLRFRASRKWVVWFDPRHPSHSFLEKSFPSMLLFRTILSYSVLIWFVYLFRVFAKRFGINL